MREIKFKVWSKAYGDWMHIDESLIAINSLTGELFGIVEGEYAPLNSNNYHLCQYTGLKDRNGREIYEGDIVHKSEKYGTWTVEYAVFGEPRFSVCDQINSCRDIECDGQRTFFSPIDEEIEIEVIGDIYSTPDLLKADTEAGEG